jgi:hypothetical protein
MCFLHKNNFLSLEQKQILSTYGFLTLLVLKVPKFKHCDFLSFERFYCFSNSSCKAGKQ